MEKLSTNYPPPEISVGGAYGHGWEVFKKYFLELFLLAILSAIIDSPIPYFWEDQVFEEYYTMASMVSQVADTRITYTSGYSLLYYLLIATPISYGIALLYLRAVRGEKIEWKELIYPFSRFLDVILSRILVFAIVGFGFVLLIIPGIIAAVRLGFVTYLVVDKEMNAIDAVKESWRMTAGTAGWNIFMMAIVAIPIAIGGLILVGVGILLSSMWISAAFASLYYAVESRRSKSTHVDSD